LNMEHGTTTAITVDFLLLGTLSMNLSPRVSPLSYLESLGGYLSKRLTYRKKQYGYESVT